MISVDSLTDLKNKIDVFAHTNYARNYNKSLKLYFLDEEIKHKKIILRMKGSAIETHSSSIFINDTNKKIQRSCNKNNKAKLMIYHNNDQLNSLNYLLINFSKTQNNDNVINFAISNKLLFANLKLVEMINFHKTVSRVLIKKFKNIKISGDFVDAEYLSNTIKSLELADIPLFTLDYSICSVERFDLNNCGFTDKFLNLSCFNNLKTFCYQDYCYYSTSKINEYNYVPTKNYKNKIPTIKFSYNLKNCILSSKIKALGSLHKIQCLLTIPNIILSNKKNNYAENVIVMSANSNCGNEENQIVSNLTAKNMFMLFDIKKSNFKISNCSINCLYFDNLSHIDDVDNNNALVKNIVIFDAKGCGYLDINHKNYQKHCAEESSKLFNPLFECTHIDGGSGCSCDVNDYYNDYNITRKRCGFCSSVWHNSKIMNPNVCYNDLMGKIFSVKNLEYFEFKSKCHHKTQILCDRFNPNDHTDLSKKLKLIVIGSDSHLINLQKKLNSNSNNHAKINY